MWHLDHELDRHFEQLREEHEAEAARGPRGKSRDPEPPMMVNTLHPKHRGKR